MTNCPKCDADISDTYEPDDPSVGIVGGWYCDACDLGVGLHEVDREHFDDDDDDVPIMTAKEFLGDRPIGTPLSELSGQPGNPNDPEDSRHAGYARFVRISKSWGYD